MALEASSIQAVAAPSSLSLPEAVDSNAKGRDRDEGAATACMEEASSAMA